MAQHVCPCCRWSVEVPAYRADALAACPECGQILRVSPPWSNADIRNGDTRNLPVPHELRNQLSLKLRDKPEILIMVGAPVVVFGAVTFVGLFFDLSASATVILWRLSEAAFVLWCGAMMVWTGIRRLRRRCRARLLHLPASLSAQIHKLGTPYTHHQMALFLRVSLLVTGLLLAGMSVLALRLLWQSHPASVMTYAIALLGLPGGVGLVGLGVWNWELLVVVFPEGLLVRRRGRYVIWRWNQVDTVVVRPGLLGRAYTLRRPDGQEFRFSLTSEYEENQLGVRAQDELRQRLVAQLELRFTAGEALAFGPLQLTPKGLHKGQHTLAWEKCDGCRLEKENAIILRSGGWDHWSIEITEVPNLIVCMELIGRAREQLGKRPASPERARVFR